MTASWTVTKKKLNGRSRVWSAFWLADDAYGHWLYAPAGTPNHTPDDEPLDTLSTDGVQLVPTDGWWVAWWWADGLITIDITTQPAVAAATVGYVDLELDFWARDGDVGLVDQEEYAASRAAGLITDDQDHAVQATVADLGRRLTAGDEPFGLIGRDKLRTVLRNEVRVLPYDPSWPIRFRVARDEMLPVLPAGTRVEHVGSTAVPGLSAKDCLDIAVIVGDRSLFDSTIAALEALGYEARRAAFDDDPDHVFIRRLSGGRRSHHLHLYVADNPNLGRVLAFRDLLRSDPAARQRYQAVKLQLADSRRFDRTGYMNGKTEVITDLLDPDGSSSDD